MTTVKAHLVIEKRYLAQFKDLYMRLEPENLTCDGELSKSEVARKYKKLRKDWKRLERQVGRIVTDEEVIEAMYPHIYKTVVPVAELLTAQVMRGE